MGARVSALGAAALLPLGLLIWLPSGPLAAAWAKRAGTPSSLLRATATGSASRASGSPALSPPSGSSAVAAGGFTAQASGTIQQGRLGYGLDGVDISLSWSGQRLSALAIHLRGRPLDGGGLEMTSSEVLLGTSANSRAYRGAVTALQGTNIAARVRARSGQVLNLVAELQIDPGSGSASGTVTVETMTAGPPALPRLLLGVGDESTVGLEGHIELHGPMPDLRRTSSGQLIELVASAGLRGRGGASFPVG